MHLWDGTIETVAVTRMLGVSSWRLNEVAEPLGFASLNGRWDVEDVKKIAARFVVVGSESERASAKEMLVGPLRSPIDPAKFNESEGTEAGDSPEAADRTGKTLRGQRRFRL